MEHKVEQTVGFLMFLSILLRGMQRIFEKKYIMDENDSLSEYIKIPLGHNRTNGDVFTPKSTSKLRSALHFSYSIVIRRFYSRTNTAQS